MAEAQNFTNSKRKKSKEDTSNTERGTVNMIPEITT